jgi:hypothetical protein
MTKIQKTPHVRKKSVDRPAVAPFAYKAVKIVSGQGLFSTKKGKKPTQGKTVPTIAASK